MSDLSGGAGLPVGLSVSPATTHGNTAHITVRDIGSMPVRVNVSTLVLHSHCAMSTTSAVDVPVRTFRLTPGQAHSLTVHVPSAQADYGVLFSAHVIGAHGARVAGAVGSQLLTGHATSCVRPPQAVKPVSHSLINPLGAVILGVIVLGTALAIWATILRRKARRAT